jgi:hypothetical protein
MADGPYFSVPKHTKATICPCGKRVYWIKTAKGKSMMVDCEATSRCVVPTNDGPGSGISHFATCSKAENFRRG